MNTNSAEHQEEAVQLKQNASKPAGGFNHMRSKLSFGRMVEMATEMGMANPLFRCHERAAKATTWIDGREYINFSTYDYLDINTHPEITKAVTHAAEVFGTSAGASRLVGGERPPHRILEQKLAQFYQVEDCIVFVSGHATNVSTLGFLFGKRDAIFHDGLAHNSLLQGARLSGAQRFSYAHNDCDALEKMLAEKRKDFKHAVIVTEGLFSMDGNIPDLPRIIRLKKQYDCMLLVDEAHSLGILGDTGRGVREYFGINPQDVDMWMSTLSKTLCGCGGFICGSHELIEFLKYGCPGFVYSVGMPPVIAQACSTALDILQREPERIKKLQDISQYFLHYARSKGLDTGAAQGYAVVPIIIGNSWVTGFLSQQLLKHGVYVMPISFPAVKEGTARLRFFISAAHQEEHVQKAIDAILCELPNAENLVKRYQDSHPDVFTDF
ncbi:MAG: aminotransferase class I/II-fold pyridoxal phosphate-dependent enzyme [Desulfovibrio sp.]|nr:aminotransferase class I/II-fold pyridoxal phosphate-dependent enzyme [Desulfovibrio sp.]